MAQRIQLGRFRAIFSQALRKNIQEFNASKARYFQTKDSGIAADFESHQVISPKGNVTLRFYGNIPKLIVELYSNRAPSIEEMKTDTMEFTFQFKDDAVWFAQLGTCVTVPSLAERLPDRLV